MTNYFDASLVLQEVRTSAERNEKFALILPKVLKTIPPNIKKTALQRMRKLLKDQPDYFYYCKDLAKDILNKIQKNSGKIHKQRVKFLKEIQKKQPFTKHKDDQNKSNIDEISKEDDEQSDDEQKFIKQGGSPPEIIEEMNQEQEGKGPQHSQYY